MSLDRTPPASLASVPINPVPNNVIPTTCPAINIECHPCPQCNEMLSEGQDCLILNECSHVFHRNCIETSLANTSECPVCKLSCQLSDLKAVTIFQKNTNAVRQSNRGKGRGAMSRVYNTRNSKKNLFQEHQNSLLDCSADLQGAASLTPTQHSRNMETIIPTRTNLVDSSEIPKLVEESLSRILANFNILPRAPSQANDLNPSYHTSRADNISGEGNNIRSAQPQISPHNVATPNRVTVSSMNMQPDKLTTIIQNWHLKFDGSPNGLNVNEFLYRIKTLTEDNFNGDFSVICRNLNILLIGKAGEWYWRYHRQASPIVWEDFCEALKYQYRDFKSTFDIREEVRNRKQKAGESFDSFYEAVSSILDRLPAPMSDMELIEILTRNLRPEIRQEILYIPINSIPHLRKLVQMRENFLNDEYVRRNLAHRSNNFLPRRQVAEISDFKGEDVESSLKNSEAIHAIQNATKRKICWNCGEQGHYWEDCLGERRVFCYGCGAANTYKPNCSFCANKKLNSSKNFRSTSLQPELT